MRICTAESRSLFSAYHAVYTEPDINCPDWRDRTNVLGEEDACYFVYENGRPIGGFAFTGESLSLPFVIAPFSDRPAFWQAVLRWLKAARGSGPAHLLRIPRADADVLTRLGAQTR